MVKTDIQERIDKVFWRATHTLPEEFININVSGPFPERGALYKAVEKDFISYSTLGNDLIEEVNANLSSDLRPTERIKYITNLNSYSYGLKDGYEFIESDEWVDKILVQFGRLFFDTDTKKPKLTEEDKKHIFEVVEEVRKCCYEFSKAADSVASIIHTFLIGYGIKPHKWGTTNVLYSPKPESTTTFTNPVPADTSTVKVQNLGQGLPNIQTVEPTKKLRWRDDRGDKSDFAELVWVLAKSQRIIDNTTNKPVTIEVLAKQLGGLFGTSISNPMQLMQARKDSFRASEDGITFISYLSELVEQYIGSK
ncbi:hypothetical protein [Larkinella sp. C7]|jgi:hypothetical protein|uniref:hypothetical protein n=1 Tax=Larkinella sp. C7 TaxID=2576607 RepID=UPI0011111D51|nr:hypothetical protein [Larkinella sp. C7]